MTTQYANANYQEIIDLHTESDRVSVIGIHTPTSNTPRKMFGGFFDQFKKFRYLGCSVSLVPAAKLPVDPLAVSYEAGEPTIDPRDMLNPIMFHGCHGNDLGVILNRLYATNSTNAITSDSVNFMQLEDYNFSGNDYPIGADNLESLYYKALVDNTWKKAHSQRGFRKSNLRPLLYQLATPYQMDGSVGLTVDGSSNVIMSKGIPDGLDTDLELATAHLTGTVSGTVDKTFKLMTPKLTSLGWLDTRNVLTSGATATIDSHLGVSDSSPSLVDQINGAIADGVDSVNNQMVEDALLPQIYMGVILLPPAYKTEQYFRMIVNHHFAFKGFRGVSFSPSVELAAYNDWNDMITSGDTGSTGDSGNDEPRPPTGGDAGGDTPTPSAPGTESNPLIYESTTGARVSQIDIGDDVITLVNNISTRWRCGMVVRNIVDGQGECLLVQWTATDNPPTRAVYSPSVKKWFVANAADPTAWAGGDFTITSTEAGAAGDGSYPDLIGYYALNHDAYSLANRDEFDALLEEYFEPGTTHYVEASQ